jgi:circadian clock protein KaiB
MRESDIETEYYHNIPVLETPTEKYVLRLYISWGNPNSSRAIHQVKKVCAQYLANRHELEIIDIRKNPEMLEQDKIFATPTLIKMQPAPVRKLVGDIPDIEELVICLNL